MIILCPYVYLVNCSKVDFDHNVIVVPLTLPSLLLFILLDTLQSHVNTPLSRVNYTLVNIYTNIRICVFSYYFLV